MPTCPAGDVRGPRPAGAAERAAAAARPDVTDCRDDEQQGVRLYLLLLALAVILLVVAGLVYLTYQHPALADPLGVGFAAAAVLVTGLGFALTRQ
ncbi:hypothetical protein [Actinacidiphila oryziradicis]|uniref:Uncharacterized protein n=1 Tax=Actinacidiphila oryziradicis TaxID=2571141 RepID=A0A4V5MV51_9ACTN|nr:hypothetical protein [Actinacidiphila oryziradicis]TJZ90818.1 hypothetical protein FCI23_55695 [Actinacidiphila oryziradicis]